MEPGRNERRQERALPRLSRDFAINALSYHVERPRIDREKRSPAGLSGGAARRAQAGRVQKRGRTRQSRPALCSEKPDRARTGAYFHARRTNPADAARMALHAVLLQRLRDESVSRQER